MSTHDLLYLAGALAKIATAAAVAIGALASLWKRLTSKKRDRQFRHTLRNEIQVALVPFIARLEQLEARTRVTVHPRPPESTTEDH